MLLGAAGGSGGALVLPNACEEAVLDSGACALSVQRSVDGQLDACVPLSQVFAGADPSELREGREVSWELEASLQRRAQPSCPEVLGCSLWEVTLADRTTSFPVPPIYLRKVSSLRRCRWTTKI